MLAKHARRVLVVDVLVVGHGPRNGQASRAALGVGGLERQLDLGRAEGVRREDQAERDRLQVVEPEVMGIDRPVIRAGCSRSRRRDGCLQWTLVVFAMVRVFRVFSIPGSIEAVGYACGELV